MWDIEEIPNESIVFTRIHKDFVSNQDGLPKKTAFQNTPHIGGIDLSCDWDKYCTPQSSREIISKEKNKKGEFKNNLDFFIWAFPVLKIRQIDNPTQAVLHRPIYHDPEIEGLPNNRAHSGIFGEKPVNDAKFRTKILRAGQWAISPQ